LGKEALTELPLIFISIPYFSIAFPTKPPIFTPPIFQSTPLTKLSLQRKKPKIEEKNFGQKLGGPEPKTGGKVAPDFDSRFGGIETAERPCSVHASNSKTRWCRRTRIGVNVFP